MEVIDVPDPPLPPWLVGPGSPTLELRPSEQCRVRPGNQEGCDLCQRGKSTVPPASGAGSGQPYGDR